MHNLINIHFYLVSLHFPRGISVTVFQIYLQFHRSVWRLNASFTTHRFLFKVDFERTAEEMHL